MIQQNIVDIQYATALRIIHISREIQKWNLVCLVFIDSIHHHHGLLLAIKF